MRQATQAAYTEGISYAVRTIADAAPEASLYLDAAHGGWLGWDDNLQQFAVLLKEMNIHEYLRGLAINVANYQPLGTKFAPWVTEEYGGSPTRNDYCLPTNNNGNDEVLLSLHLSIAEILH